jgi:hypothetical protein
VSLTSYLGTQDSRLTNLILGQWLPRVIPGRIGTVINLKGHYQPNLPIRRRLRTP